MCFFPLPPVFKLIDPQPPGLNLSGFIYLFIYFLNFAAIVELLPCVSTYDSSNNKIKVTVGFLTLKMKILKKSFAVQFHLHILFKKNDTLTIFLQQILSSRLLLLR